MTRVDASEPGAGSRFVDSFLEAKLHRPPTRVDWVDRGRLVGQLDQAIQRPVTLIAAPAGYGKTTLVAQWLAGNHHPRAAWLSLDTGDNDPGRFWTHLATALERVGCVMPTDLADVMMASSGEWLTGVLPRMVNALAATPDDVVILLDDFHFVRERELHDQIEFLIEHLPPHAHLVIITRADPGLRLGRLRASGGLAEIRADDLSFNDEEASALLDHGRVHLSTESMTQLMRRTEGWPAGFYLATLSLAGRQDPNEFVRQFSGGNRFVVDYLTEEVLSRHTPEIRDWIMATSILDRFSAPLCDVVTDTTNSADLLQDLERTNLFLVPLDEERRWFRFHHLFGAVARNQLAVEHPDRLETLHARAAHWFRDNGHVDEAVMHSLAAGRTNDAAMLVRASWLSYVDAGRAATVLGWLESLGPVSVADDPAAGVTAAWLAALFGHEETLAAHLEALEEFADYGPLPDGSRSVESAVAMIRGVFGYGGPIEMAQGAQRAVELETDGRSPYYAIAQMTLGHSAYVAGDLELASVLLAKASHSEAAPSIILVLSLSAQSLVEAEWGQHERSREFAEHAMQVVEANGLDNMPQASMAFTALGQAQAAAGKLDDAMATLQQGLAMRLKNPVLGPWGMIHHLLATARVAVSAGQLTFAHDLLSDVTTRMNRYDGGMQMMQDRLSSVHEALRMRLAETTPREPLTDREKDVLRLLQGSLNLHEIAREMFVSFNTVKTHTQAIYRKLDTHSRAEAVRIARQNQLI
jgi:LuxR family maltose regulon positive regulatory protein